MPTIPKRKRPKAKCHQPIPVTDNRPTRAEILAGINYQPLEPMEGVPEWVRAAEDQELQDYLVAWTQGVWDHINGTKTTTKGRKRRVVENHNASKPAPGNARSISLGTGSRASAGTRGRE